MTAFRTYRLSVPLVTPKGVIQEVTVHRAQAKDLAKIERRAPTPTDNFALVEVLIETLAGIPEGWAGNLDAADFTALAEHVAAALEASPRPAPARGKPLWKG